MESSGQCLSPFTHTSPGFLSVLRDVEPRVVRRRLSQARHRAKLASLFNHLRDTVYSQPNTKHRTTSKWQVLRKAKHYILDLEKKLDGLLKLKEANHLDDGQPSSLAGVKEQYINNLYKEQCGDLATAKLPGKTREALWQWLKEHRQGFAETDVKPAGAESPVNTSADLIEFEGFYQKSEQMCQENGTNQLPQCSSTNSAEATPQSPPSASKALGDLQLIRPNFPLGPDHDLKKSTGYLCFYKETMDLLVENGIVSMEQIGLPIVSKAISHLWQGMSTERKGVIFKKCLSPRKAIALQLPVQVEYSLRDKILDSQGASASSESTPDEVLFEDAFDFASGFLIKSESNAHTGIKRENSSAFTHCVPENPAETCVLYKQIVNFVKAQCDATRHLPQDGSPNLDDEAFLLRCTETFDDDL